MRKNVYRLTIECEYKDGGGFTEEVHVAAASSNLAERKARAEVARRYKSSDIKVSIKDFSCVEKIAEDLVT